MTASAVAPPAPGGLARTTAGGLAGVRALTRLAVRRDRIMLPVWIYAITAAVAEVAFALKKVYPTPASRRSLVTSVGHNPALSFLYGRLNGSSLGALTAWRYLAYGALGAALMSIFLVIRHTRADEQAGRLELVGSAAVGRQAPLTASLSVAGIANLVLMVLIAAALSLLRLPLAGSIAFGLAAGGCGLVFAALAAVAAQAAETARGARGAALAALGAAFLLRGIGDSAGVHGPTWLSWLSPIGWAEAVRPYHDQRWWVLALPAVAAAVLGCLAFWLAAHRDQGAGMIPARPGSPVAGPLLRGSSGLAWRLQRGSLIGWTFALIATGAAVGSVAKGIGSLLGSGPGVRNVLERLGGQTALTNAYLAGVMSFFGLLGAAYAVSVVLRLRAEETDGLGDPVLAAATGRIRWAAGHLSVAVLGSAIALAAGGVSTGLFYALRAGDPGTQVWRLVGAALAQLPAVLAVAAVAMVLVGLAPRWAVPGSWTVVALAAVITLFGPAVKASQWLLDISPFSHVPKLPGGAVSATPLIWLSAAALALAALGVAGLRRRDIG